LKVKVCATASDCTTFSFTFIIQVPLALALLYSVKISVLRYYLLLNTNYYYNHYGFRRPIS